MSIHISRLLVKGYKTIKSIDLKPNQINVLIGANGSGKSNFIRFLDMMRNMMAPPNGGLQEYLAVNEVGAHSVLHKGPDTTDSIEAEMRIETEKGHNDYRFVLKYASGDRLVFIEESYRYTKREADTDYPWQNLHTVGEESGLLSAAESNESARVIQSLLRLCLVYQFHNTSRQSPLRRRTSIWDNKHLDTGGDNIAPFLYRLKKEEPRSFRHIEDCVRLIAPFFSHFDFSPSIASGSEQDAEMGMLLSWREKGNDELMTAPQAADGMLRAIALVTLLCQPTDGLPGVLFLDEPELGLHPSAIETIAALIQQAAEYSQVFVATQSPLLVNQFEPEDIVAVDRRDSESTYERLERKELGIWLEDYSLGEVWLKGLTGAMPNA